MRRQLSCRQDLQRRLRRGPAPSAENQAADCKVYQRPAHIDQDERPLVRFEGGEHGDGRVFDEKKGKPRGGATFKPAIAFVAFTRAISHASV